MIYLFEESFEGIEVGGEGSPAFWRRLIFCMRLASDKTFVNGDKGILFEIGQVTGQIPIREPQFLFEFLKAHALIDHQEGHDSQPDAIFECFVQIM